MVETTKTSHTNDSDETLLLNVSLNHGTLRWTTWIQWWINMMTWHAKSERKNKEREEGEEREGEGERERTSYQLW